MNTVNLGYYGTGIIWLVITPPKSEVYDFYSRVVFTFMYNGW